MNSLADLLRLYKEERGGSPAEIARGVDELSRMFNGLSPLRPGYLASRSLRRAYVHYYLPVNLEKTARVLRELARYRPFTGKPLRVLDFGSGPGTAALAFLLAGGAAADLVLVDAVDEALDDARFLCGLLGVRPRTLHEIPRGERFDLVLAANVLNERAAPLEDALADDGHWIAIEPATRTATSALIRRRDELVERGFRIAAPCLGQARCPLQGRADLWCHQDLAWERPAGVAATDRRTGLDKESVKFSYFVATLRGATLSDVLGPGARRVVSNLHREKGKAWATTCGADGPACCTEILTRHRGPETAAFFHAQRGDVLKIEVKGEACRSEGPVGKLLGL
jgi:SAM-dependent methyltransferase